MTNFGCVCVSSYQFFLQTKRDIAEGRLPVESELAAELAAFAVQCKIHKHADMSCCVMWRTRY